LGSDAKDNPAKVPARATMSSAIDPIGATDSHTSGPKPPDPGDQSSFLVKTGEGNLDQPAVRARKSYEIGFMLAHADEPMNEVMERFFIAYTLDPGNPHYCLHFGIAAYHCGRYNQAEFPLRFAKSGFQDRIDEEGLYGKFWAATFLAMVYSKTNQTILAKEADEEAKNAQEKLQELRQAHEKYNR
jgi:hypothetical protein